MTVISNLEVLLRKSGPIIGEQEYEFGTAERHYFSDKSMIQLTSTRAQMDRQVTRPLMSADEGTNLSADGANPPRQALTPVAGVSWATALPRIGRILGKPVSDAQRHANKKEAVRGWFIRDAERDEHWCSEYAQDRLAWWPTSGEDG